MRTYAVIWRCTKGPVHAGSLELGEAELSLDGGSAHKTISYDEVGDVHVGRGADERLQGRNALVLRVGSGTTLYVASVNGPGVVVEIAEQLAALGAGS